MRLRNFTLAEMPEPDRLRAIETQCAALSGVRQRGLTSSGSVRAKRRDGDFGVVKLNFKELGGIASAAASPFEPAPQGMRLWDVKAPVRIAGNQLRALRRELIG